LVDEGHFAHDVNCVRCLMLDARCRMLLVRCCGLSG
jgi:hypothetical protein